MNHFVVAAVIVIVSACSSNRLRMLSLSHSMLCMPHRRASCLTYALNTLNISSIANSSNWRKRKMQTIQMNLIHADWLFICLHVSDAFIMETSDEKDGQIFSLFKSNDWNFIIKIQLDLNAVDIIGRISLGVFIVFSGWTWCAPPNACRSCLQ